MSDAGPVTDRGVLAETGLFVVFEGGDAVGKSTQVKALVEWVSEQGVPVVATFEPGDTPIGRTIRRAVLDPATGDLSPRTEALLYAADKAQHLAEVVLPALAAGSVVVCDRYVDSMLAYQGAGRVLAPAELETVARWATEDLRPHLTVLLDLDPGEAVAAKVDKDRLEAAGRRPAPTGPGLLPGSGRGGPGALPGAPGPTAHRRDRPAGPRSRPPAAPHPARLSCPPARRRPQHPPAPTR